jgi:membrane protein required for colicin V production
MEIVDIVILVATLASMVVGWFRGLVKEAMSIAALLLAIWAAMRLGPAAGGWLGGTIDSTELQLWAGRFLVFVIVLTAGAVIGWSVSKIIHMSGLSGFDKAFGGFFGLLRAALFLGVFILTGRYAGFDAELWWLQSEIIPYGEYIADWIVEMAPRGMEMLQHMPDDLSL